MIRLVKCKNPDCDNEARPDPADGGICADCSKFIMERFGDGHMNCIACEGWLQGKTWFGPMPWDHKMYIECENL